MIPAERQKKLLKLVDNNKIVSVFSLAEELHVSHMTIRRDIKKLEQDGFVVSVSGGVKSLEHLFIEPTHNDKSLLSKEQKKSIGNVAGGIIPSNTTIFLDAGTTTLEIAYNIVDREDLLVVTNDFVIANFLMKYGKCRLIHIGGFVNKDNYSSVGELASYLLQKLVIDIAFISTSSWNLKGLTTPDENKLPVKLAVIKSSQKKILVSDSSKYGKNATFHICSLSVFDTIITDSDLLINAQEIINSMGIKLILS